MTIPLESKRHARLIESLFFCVDNNCTLTKNSGAQESEFCEAGMANIDSFFSYSDILKRGRIKIFLSGAQYSEKDSCSFVDVA